MAIELVIGIGFACVLFGVGLGYVLFGRGAGRSKVAELESALESAQDELKDYRTEVYDQFAETAEKFKNLDRSYHDLHRQLAVSSATLLGDQETPLLASPDAPEEASETQVAAEDDGDVLEGETEAGIDDVDAAEEIEEPIAEVVVGEAKGDDSAVEVEIEPTISDATEAVEGTEAQAGTVDVEVPTLTEEPLEPEGAKRRA